MVCSDFWGGGCMQVYTKGSKKDRGTSIYIVIKCNHHAFSKQSQCHSR